MNKKTMGIIALAILILVSVSYFITLNNEKENKVKKQVTSPQKKIEVDVKQTDKEIEEELKPLVQKQKESVRGKIIYKNDETNEGYNMELIIPEKWAHLDYSRLGNPKETELPKEEWAAGDELYEKGHPDYYKDGKTYFSAKAEKILLDIFQDRKTLSYIIDDEEKAQELFKNHFDDINKLIYIDEETGRKELVTDSKYENRNYNRVKAFDYLFESFGDELDETSSFVNWIGAARSESYGLEDEDLIFYIYKKWAMRHNLIDNIITGYGDNINEGLLGAYENHNRSSSLKWREDYEEEFCLKGKDISADECQFIEEEEFLNKYLK